MSQEITFRTLRSPVRRVCRASERISEAKCKLARTTERIPETFADAEKVRRELAEVLLILHDAEDWLTPALEEGMVQ
jgi:hypothetical protein